MRILTSIAVICVFAGCNATQKTRCDDPESADCPTSPVFGGGASASDVQVTSLKPLVAKPGQEVTVSGLNLTNSAILQVGDQLVPWTSAAGASAKFMMPVTPRAGAFAVKIGRAGAMNGTVDAAAKFMIADSAGDAYPIYMATPDKICSPEVFRDAEGELRIGTKNCGVTDVDPWDIRAGVSVGGVTGQLKVNCRNRANRAIQDMGAGINVTVSNNTLTSTSNHGLTQGTKVRMLYTSPPTNVIGYAPFYVIYVDDHHFMLSAENPGPIFAMDGGTDVSIHRLDDGVADVWDSIDDYNNTLGGLPPHLVAGWASNDCGGVEVLPGDVNVWQDVTKTISNNIVIPSTCADSVADCSMRDKISGLSWSKKLASVSSWSKAVIDCDALTHSQMSDWRLPTQKELMDAYSHGIRSAASSQWVSDSDMAQHFWSASTHSGTMLNGWSVYLANGYTYNAFAKTDTNAVICVRP